MRGGVEGLLSPHPLIDTLPALYREGAGAGHDSFVERLCAALDDVLAPVVSTLDNSAAYLDVTTAPADLLPWLAHWIGMSLDPGRPTERQREVLRQAGQLHGWQGTRRGIELAVEAVFGLPTVVVETGAASWSTEADAPLPGEPYSAFVVQVTAPAGATVDERRLDALVMTLKPAQVVHRVQVVQVVQ